MRTRLPYSMTVHYPPGTRKRDSYTEPCWSLPVHDETAVQRVRRFAATCVLYRGEEELFRYHSGNVHLADSAEREEWPREEQARTAALLEWYRQQNHLVGMVGESEVEGTETFTLTLSTPQRFRLPWGSADTAVNRVRITYRLPRPAVHDVSVELHGEGTYLRSGALDPTTPGRFITTDMTKLPGWVRALVEKHRPQGGSSGRPHASRASVQDVEQALAYLLGPERQATVDPQPGEAGEPSVTLSLTDLTSLLDRMPGYTW